MEMEASFQPPVGDTFVRAVDRQADRQASHWDTLAAVLRTYDIGDLANECRARWKFYG